MANEESQAVVDTTMWTSLLHAGLAGSFLKLPHVPPDADALRSHGAQAAIYGIPWDSTSISRTGANYGPRGIREISGQFLTYNATWDFDLVEALNPVDCGDCDVVLANAAKTFDRAEADIAQILDAGAIPATLGGDHSVTIPAVRAVRKKFSNPGLVLIDTHLDTALDVGGEELNHCCPITRAVDAGFDPTKMALLAISGWMNPRTELRFCRENLELAMRELGHDHVCPQQSMNLFMNIPVAADGGLGWEPAPTKPGDSITFRAVMDAIVVVSACPQDIVPINDRNPTAVAVELLED